MGMDINARSLRFNISPVKVACPFVLMDMANPSIVIKINMPAHIIVLKETAGEDCLEKNVAFGSRGYESNKPEKNPEYSKPAEQKDEVAPDALEASLHLSPGSSSREEHLEARERDNVGISIPPSLRLNQ
ncbi:hypothetical protein SAY87_019499 [Trapa incisa]|uniref:Uncharacterized protein n=1 Tax=Trapa incisa TaxID=236973 RepID=A0AAN7K5V2_9MYRT|nr:hypothetical protein SAY87_019499 [Trapa incisa]